MAFNRNQMTPLSKGGARTVHAGKGSKAAPMHAKAAVTGPTAPGINNYAKASPTIPSPVNGQATPPGLGSGVWPGISGAP
jgi:hypothetical protein